MFKIPKEMTEKEKTFEKLILQMRFCDLVDYREDANRFFEEGMSDETPWCCLKIMKRKLHPRREHEESMERRRR